MKENNEKLKNLKKILSAMEAIGLRANHLLKAKEIVDAMQTYKFSIADIQAAERKVRGFDLLVAYYDVMRRVPFEEGKNLDVIGIFPNSSDVYISLKEYDYPRKRCNEDKIATEAFWKGLVPIIDDLNECIRALRKPIIEGCYYAKGDFMSDCNWIVGIGGQFGKTLASDYYGDSERAKYRPISTHK